MLFTESLEKILAIAGAYAIRKTVKKRVKQE